MSYDRTVRWRPTISDAAVLINAHRGAAGSGIESRHHSTRLGVRSAHAHTPRSYSQTQQQSTVNVAPNLEGFSPVKFEPREEGVPQPAKEQRLRPSQGAEPNVGLLRAQSPWLRKDGVCIALFPEKSMIHFVGCVQLRVLAGLVLCSGYIFKPSTKWHEMFVPVSLGQPSLSLMPMSPSFQDPEFATYLKPFRSCKGLHFHSSSSLGESVSCSDHEGCVVIDLEGKDLQHMNQLAKADWKKTVAIALLKPLKTPFYQLLRSFIPSATLVNGQWIDGFQTVRENLSISVPDFYRKIAWDLAQLSGVSLLVCGPIDIGKSTLCRYLTNYLLNRWPIVCYIECDVGQTEFTVSGVVALHLLNEPVHGPPMTHLRTPAKAYYFGASTPANNPEYYYRVVQGLQRHLVKVVRPAYPDIPVIINTCGWVRDMGFSLLLDLIRLFRPSHIVQLLDPSPMDTSFHLTPTLFTYFSGIYSRPETGGGGALTVDYAAAQEEASRREAVDGGVITEEEETEDMDTQQLSVDGDSNEAQSCTSAGEVEEDSSSFSDAGNYTSDEMPLMTVGCHSHRHSGGVAASSLDVWTQLLSHQLFKTCVRIPVTSSSYKNKILLRQLVTLSYFSPLLDQAISVAKEHGVGADVYSNFLFCAPPLEIPWSDVAIHVVNCQVPRSQVLYALNGRVVTLGQVQSKEIVSCDVESPGVGVVKFLKSNDPLIEFIGLGLLRATDVTQQRFFVTTPLSLTPELLDRVNVMAVGRTDMLPYLLDNQISLSSRVVPSTDY